MAITTNFDKGVAQITIDRPEKRNTLDTMHCVELTKQLNDADSNPNIKTIVLTGLTNVFIAGLDIQEMHADPHTLVDAFDKLMIQIDQMTKPVIAAVNGPAVAQGVAVLYHCDMVYCSEHSLFSLPNVALGLTPQYGTSLLTVRSAGYRMAFRKIAAAEPISPSEAVEMGIVNNVLSDDKVLSQAIGMASRLASMPPRALYETKQLLKDIYFKGLGKQAKVEHDVYTELLDGPEHKEALAAFMENRKPDFTPKGN